LYQVDAVVVAGELFRVVSPVVSIVSFAAFELVMVRRLAPG
jgi:hypothetical protein